MKIDAGQLRELLEYDPDTGVFSWRSTRGRVTAGSRAGTLNSKGYRAIKLGYHLYEEHRLAYLYMTGEWPAGVVDHINRTPSDNRWSNLRNATRSLNNANVKVRSHSRSGIKGVSKVGRGYSARITGGGVRWSLGTYVTPEEARAAYAGAAKVLFGQFARVE